LFIRLKHKFDLIAVPLQERWLEFVLRIRRRAPHRGNWIHRPFKQSALVAPRCRVGLVVAVIIALRCRITVHPLLVEQLLHLDSVVKGVDPCQTFTNLLDVMMALVDATRAGLGCDQLVQDVFVH